MLLYYYRNHSDHRTIIIVSVWPKPKQIWYGLGLGFIGVWSTNSGGRHQSIWFCSSPACLLIIWSWLNFRCNKMQRKLLPRWCCRQQKSGPYSKQEAAPYCGSVRAREDWFNLVSNFWTRLQRSVFIFFLFLFGKKFFRFLNTSGTVTQDNECFLAIVIMSPAYRADDAGCFWELFGFFFGTPPQSSLRMCINWYSGKRN